MREVQHVNKTDVDNKTETQVQNQVKRKVVPYIMKEVQHVNKNEVDNKTETQVQNQVKMKSKIKVKPKFKIK